MATSQRLLRLAALLVIGACSSNSAPPAASEVSSLSLVPPLSTVVPGATGDPPTTSTSTSTSIASIPPTSLSPSPPSSSPLGEVVAAEVIGQIERSSDGFTQGLIVDGDEFIESTGIVGDSALRRVDRATGAVTMSVAIDPTHFGEGLASTGDTLVQLTWKNGVASVYDEESFELLTTYTYEGEGWGLTFDGVSLVMSDGSPTISFRSPSTFEIERQITVTADGAPVEELNELEMVDGELWANVWRTDRIARIDPQSGVVIGWIDIAALRPVDTLKDNDAVANGIAFDPLSRQLYVTGKRWPVIFEIALPVG